MWNNQEHVEAYCAIPSMGAVLHTLNLRLAPEQLVYIINHAEDRVVIVDGSLVAHFAGILPELGTVRTVILTGEADSAPLHGLGAEIIQYDDFIAGQPNAYTWPAVEETCAAAMCYTSGTTGNPKGVVYSHRSTYLHSMAACAKDSLGVGADDAVLAIVPMFHANAWGLVYAALMAGADLVLPDRFLQPDSLVSLIETQRPTIAGAVPTIWNDVLNHLEGHPQSDISSLELVACGGSAVPRHLMEAFERRYGVRILQAWGMTETSPLAAIARPSLELSVEEHWAVRVTQGRPVCGVEARIVDDEGKPQPHDGKAVGELEVRGPWITARYFQDEGTDKFHDGWLRTGDVGRIDSAGFITLTDRAKDVIKSGGEWISSVELELLIAGHPSVLEAAVIGVPDDRWQERPLAAVVLREGLAATPEELKGHLSGSVANWWLPERWSFIDAVPKTSVGKFDKKVLRAQYAQGLLLVEET
jgi:fatty-acyl-CoA synthase